MDDRVILAWSSRLAAIAQTGLAFTESLYERERYQEVISVASEMRAEVQGDAEGSQRFVEEFLAQVGEGVPGYVTPKCAIGAAVVDSERRLLLVKRSDSGIWLYPTGWADVGYSASEVVVKEVHEETGVDVVPVKLLAVLDGMQRGAVSNPWYSLVFLCEPQGGKLVGHPLEVTDVGWFGAKDLPPGFEGFAALPWLSWIFEGRQEPESPYFDLPRRARGVYEPRP